MPSPYLEGTSFYLDGYEHFAVNEILQPLFIGMGITLSNEVKYEVIGAEWDLVVRNRKRLNVRIKRV